MTFNLKDLTIDRRNLSPEDFECPILRSQMFDPVALRKCHHIFERSAITAWLESKPSCPLCNTHGTQFFSADELYYGRTEKIKNTAKKLFLIQQAGALYKIDHPDEKEEPIVFRPDRNRNLDAYIARRIEESNQIIRTSGQFGLAVTSLLFIIILYQIFTTKTTPDYYL